MAMLEINGRDVEVDDSFLSLSRADQEKTVDEIAAALGQRAPATPDQQAAPKTGRLPGASERSAEVERDKYYSSGIYSGAYNPLGPIAKSIDAFSSGAQRAPLFGWDDEAVAATRSLGGNTSYSEAQKQEDAKKAAMRSQNPVASTVGELAGGLATGGTIASTGATLAGRSLPVIGRTGAAALEGAGYGALTGAGEARPGGRGEGALFGALVGGVTGAGVSKAADIYAGAAARNASIVNAPSVDVLTSMAQNLYQQADQAQIVLKPQTTDKLINNMTFAAGRPNDKLRPNTLGIVEDIQALRGKPISLSQFHELRQEVNLAMKNAQPQDERTLMRMKTIIDAAADNATANDVTGNVQGFKLFKEANSVWAKRAKAQKIEELFDLADVKSAKYSQSGMQNAIRDKASQLYTQIAKGKEKGFSGEEVALIRQLAKSEMTPRVVNWLSKFAPRGVVSAGAGSAVGGLLGSVFGPPGIAIGAAAPGVIGFGAANVADRAAVQGFNALRNAAATGSAPALKNITNKSVPFIGSVSGLSASQLPRLKTN
ncbi:hypothetical protein FY152_04315 [Agrobacterium tumefaciens]|nr:hypothetical protein FY152_04315 [Agrobacterium tumefaciens]